MDTSSSGTTSGKKGRTISEDMLELVQNLSGPRQAQRPSQGKMTLNQMMAQQKATASLQHPGQRQVYPTMGYATAPFHGHIFPTFHTFPYPYQKLSDGSIVAVSQVDDVSGTPPSTSSTSSSGSNMPLQQQPSQQPPATSASWVQWQQQ